MRRKFAPQKGDKPNASPKEKSEHKRIGAVVQPVRMPACHAGGRGFESRPHRQRREENEKFLAAMRVSHSFFVYDTKKKFLMQVFRLSARI